MPTKLKQNPYSVHPGLEMNVRWIASLKEKTGRSLAEWLDFITKKGPASEEGRRDWLKKELDMGTVTASWFAERSVGKGGAEDTAEDYLKTATKYVEDMYSGPKAALRPIHDALVAMGLDLGKDVKICPCKTIVPFYRAHVFAEVKPSTRTRIDFGLSLTKYKGKLPKRLIDTGGAAKKDRITHKIEVTSLEVVDAELKKWAKIAYDLDA